MNFICTADWHLRSDKPRCRLDEDWFAFQESIVEFIVETANKRNVPVMIVGDIFDTPNVPANIMTMLLNQLSKMRNKVYFLAGNHDLPYHSMDNIDSSAIGILKSISARHPIIHHGMTCGLWSDFGNFSTTGLPNTGIVFTHQLTFENSKIMPPNVQALTAADLLDLYPSAKWIFTGDNHHHFHYGKKGRHVINPGCISRQHSDFIDYKPMIYHVDTDKEVIEEIELPDDGAMVTDSYIKEANEREDRIGAFVEGVKKNGKVSLSFLDNLEEAILKNRKLDKGTIRAIRELVEE